MPVIDVAAPHVSRVPCGCRDNPDGSPRRRGCNARANLAPGARGHRVEQRLVKQRQHNLCLRVAETRVELEDAHTIRR